MTKNYLKGFMKQLAILYSTYKIGYPGTNKSLFFVFGKDVPIAINTNKLAELEAYIRPYKGYVIGLLNIPLPKHSLTDPADRYCLMYFPSAPSAPQVSIYTDMSLELLDRDTGEITALDADPLLRQSLIRLIRDIEPEDDMADIVFDYEFFINGEWFRAGGELYIEEGARRLSSEDEHAFANFRITLGYVGH